MTKIHIKPCNCKTCMEAREQALQKQREEIVEMVKEYLLMKHEHYGDLPFKKGRPYIDSLDFEKFIINSLK